MDKNKFIRLQQTDNPLKIDKDLIEIQKTIICYSEKILEKLSEIEKLLQQTNKVKDVTMNIIKDPINEYLKKLIKK